MAKAGKVWLSLKDDPARDAADPAFAADWQLWIRQVEALYRRWLVHEPDDDPFAYNETASASILACAATMTGGLAIADFHTEKRKMAGREDTGRWCRGDLWIRHPSGNRWAIEFKQFLPGQPIELSPERLARRLRAAKADAKMMSRAGVEYRLGGLIVSTWWNDARGHPDPKGVLVEAEQLAPWSARFGQGRSQILILLADHKVPDVVLTGDQS